LEAPVSGSKGPAIAGQLIILSAGDKTLYDEVTPAFDAMGKKSFYLGEVGHGAKMKLVVNMIMGTMMTSFSEGLCLADKAGLKQEDLLDVLDLGVMANGMFKLKGPSMIKGEFPPAFPLKHQQKDLRLALALGDELSQTMPVAAAANELYKKGRDLGLGDKDFSAVQKTLS
jgi:glyoxylate/succinic semialdehyde reductase